MDGWAALADPTRRTIFSSSSFVHVRWGSSPRCSPISRPAVSHHLKLLKTAGLVSDRAEGTRRIYQSNPDGLAEMRAQLDRFWNQTLGNFKQLVEQPEEDT